MPKRGLDVNACEIFRFYRVIAIKDLVEPLSMIVPRKKSGTFHEDLYPMTAGGTAAMTAQEWLAGINRSPVLISLRPSAKVVNPYHESLADKKWYQHGPKNFLEEQLAYQDAKYRREVNELSGWQPDETQASLWTYDIMPHCCEPAERPPPTTEDELLDAFYKQQDEIRGLREALDLKDVRIAQLEEEVKSSKNQRSAPC